MCRKDCNVLFKRLHFNLQWKLIDIHVPQRIIRKDSGDCRTVFLCRNNSKPLQRPIRLFMMRYHRKWANYKRHCGCSWSSDDEPLAQSEQMLDCTQKDIRLRDGPAHFGRSLINVGQKLKLIGFLIKCVAHSCSPEDEAFILGSPALFYMVHEPSNQVQIKPPASVNVQRNLQLHSFICNHWIQKSPILSSFTLSFIGKHVFVIKPSSGIVLLLNDRNIQ